jgi:hypothetical protein
MLGMMYTEDTMYWIMILQKNWYVHTVYKNYMNAVFSGIPRGVWEVQTPPKFRSFDKAKPNSQLCGKYVHNNLIRIQVSLICKLSGTPDYRANAPRSPFSLPSVLNWICLTTPPPPPNPEKNSWVCHWLYYILTVKYWDRWNGR